MVLFVLGAAAALAPGCQPEVKILRVRGPLDGLPGTEGGVKPDVDAEPAPEAAEEANAFARFLGPERGAPQTDLDIAMESGRELTAEELSGLRTEDERGVVTLRLRSPSDVMYHLMTTLDRGEDDLLFEQVLAERTKQEYRKLARDPREAVDWLKRNRNDIARLMAALPLGEQTPGVWMRPAGPGGFALKAPPEYREGLRFTTLEVCVENGAFRLQMIR
ncbi:MAG: hypothetical protein SFZ24_02850 [Planctomycetota bacterium]|nr:hypothetical protein [Planctomycetota bacterium]